MLVELVRLDNIQLHFLYFPYRKLVTHNGRVSYFDWQTFGVSSGEKPEYCIVSVVQFSSTSHIGEIN